MCQDQVMDSPWYTHLRGRLRLPRYPRHPRHPHYLQVQLKEQAAEDEASQKVLRLELRQAKDAQAKAEALLAASRGQLRSKALPPRLFLLSAYDPTPLDF